MREQVRDYYQFVKCSADFVLVAICFYCAYRPLLLLTLLLFPSLPFLTLNGVFGIWMS